MRVGSLEITWRDALFTVKFRVLGLGVIVLPREHYTRGRNSALFSKIYRPD